ncbi:cysteine-rich repeat secretory protein 60-like isoform X2 [Abrus precatorius]|uniref:Cysteine-rich repeat secretory protein 60-like isoform X2 n=1 Tax=Abrus precatorius TaxID=3816 RepID=A0A8B8JP67_ABRPR|nr:cysteine-rich repeat secretory protein 60-like isoform X2 [Abrus precatorius]
MTLSLIIFLLSVISFPRFSVSSSTSEFLYSGCTQQRYTPNSAYESNLDSLLTSLVNSATYSSYNNFTIVGSTPQDVVYGLYQCRGDLAMPDCATCVARAVTRAGDLCRETCGGAVQLDGCFVKYDNATFLGVEDKTVVLKQCGPSVGYNPDAMGSRDAVLAGLAGSGGNFRVGGSGGVRGVAQCSGDLSSGECEDCVSEAISRLKSDCGTADYGDMFLGKCYARYSTGGAHHESKAHGKSSKEGQKTFAIIIGSLAGVAILIIFLAFLSKICGRQGK